MDKALIEDQEYTGIHFGEAGIQKAKYEYCTFKDCTFTGADLFEVAFIDCDFESCDFSNANIAKVAFREVRFKQCKMLGLHFEHCDSLLLSIELEGCQLNFSSFYQINLKQTLFNNCQLHEVDFTEADLSEAILNECDLAGAVFDRTNLEKADLRSAYNYIINPEINRISKAKFSLAGLPGLVQQYGIVVE